jgi:hypothetical protein
MGTKVHCPTCGTACEGTPTGFFKQFRCICGEAFVLRLLRHSEDRRAFVPAAPPEILEGVSWPLR